MALVVTLAGLWLGSAPPPPPPDPSQMSDAQVRDQIARVRQYTLAVLSTGSAPEPPAAELAALQAEHLRYLFTLKRDGVAALAGPLGAHPHIRGLIIFATSDVEAARQLAAADPLVRRDLLRADVYAFFGIPGDVLP